MSAVYSVRFAITTGAAAAYTVPAGKRAVIKHVSVVNSSGAVRLFSVSIGSNPVLYEQVPALGYRQLGQLTIVAYSGETMHIGAETAVTVSVSGYLLDA